MLCNWILGFLVINSIQIIFCPKLLTDVAFKIINTWNFGKKPPFWQWYDRADQIDCTSFTFFYGLTAIVPPPSSISILESVDLHFRLGVFCGMDSSSCSSPLSVTGSESDFGFAFNDINFSDRVLRIEIVSHLPDLKSDVEGCSSIAGWARDRKRRREEIKKDNGRSFIIYVYEYRALCFVVVSTTEYQWGLCLCCRIWSAFVICDLVAV